MKGIAPLFLGIFGTFAFSWFGLILIPNAQIGRLDPQTDEEGADAYPMPKSGMAERGRQVYTANGCVYCHSQQVRPDYAASDIERKWGSRRSAPRDYLFERPALLGKMRMGPDLANVGQRAPADDETAPAPATTGATGAAAPAPGAPTAAGPEPGAVVPPAGAPAAAPPPGATVAAAAPAAGTGAAAVAPAAAAVAAAPPAA
nr:cbb3-type cytochrome c oxidase subunit II [Chthoniobacterales bacterium]